MKARINNEGMLEIFREEIDVWIETNCPFGDDRARNVRCPLMEDFDKIIALRCGGTSMVFEKEVIKKWKYAVCITANFQRGYHYGFRTISSS